MYLRPFKVLPQLISSAFLDTAFSLLPLQLPIGLYLKIPSHKISSAQNLVLNIPTISKSRRSKSLQGTKSLLSKPLQSQNPFAQNLYRVQNPFSQNPYNLKIPSLKIPSGYKIPSPKIPSGYKIPSLKIPSGTKSLLLKSLLGTKSLLDSKFQFVKYELSRLSREKK